MLAPKCILYFANAAVTLVLKFPMGLSYAAVVCPLWDYECWLPCRAALPACVLISVAMAIFWSVALLAVPNDQAVGTRLHLLWLPLGPLCLNLIGAYVLSSSHGARDDVQRLKHSTYNFKKA